MPKTNLWSQSAPRVEIDQRSRDARLRFERTVEFFLVRRTVTQSRLRRLLYVFTVGRYGGLPHGGGEVKEPASDRWFLAFFGLERYTAMHRSREHVHALTTHEQELGTLSAGGLALHSFLDGVAIGVGFQTSAKEGLLIALGIITHDLGDGLNTVAVVLAHGNPLRHAAF